MNQLLTKIKLWLAQYFCDHVWEEKHWNKGHYDQEGWFECEHCKKQYTK